MAEAIGDELVQHLVTKADFDINNAAVKADFVLLRWMIGFNLAFSAAILWRVFG